MRDNFIKVDRDHCFVCGREFDANFDHFLKVLVDKDSIRYLVGLVGSYLKAKIVPPYHQDFFFTRYRKVANAG